jgi:tetrahydromethanopterin S-methyltransferase subunit G
MSDTEYNVVSEQIKGLTTLINAQFMEVHSRLDKINGKVGKHDEQIQEALIERAKNREEQKNMIPVHINSCPNLSEIRGCRIKIENVEERFEQLEQKLEDGLFILKYPKLFIAGLAIIVILTIGTFLSNNPLKAYDNFVHPKPQTEQVK